MTSLIRAPSVVMSSRRTELVSIFSDPATVRTILFNFPVRNLMVCRVKKVDANTRSKSIFYHVAIKSDKCTSKQQQEK